MQNNEQGGESKKDTSASQKRAVKPIAILDADHLAPDLKKQFISYSVMIEKFLKTVEDNLSFTSFSVVDNVFPIRLSDYSGFIITGSKYSVQDDEEWIRKLETLIKELRKNSIPLVGICFGHQLVAKAFGGSTTKLKHGWQVGVQPYNFFKQPEWMKTPPNNVRNTASLNLLSSHQEHVEHRPEGAKNLASNERVPHLMMQLGNSILTVQGHPEFTMEYSEALMRIRREKLGEDVFAAGLHSLDNGHDGNLVAHWLVEFFKYNWAMRG